MEVSGELRTLEPVSMIWTSEKHSWPLSHSARSRLFILGPLDFEVSKLNLSFFEM
jgi:hypothetical protein